MLRVISLVCILIGSCLCFLSVGQRSQFIIDFVQYKETGMAVYLTCFEKYEVVEIGNIFAKQANFRFAFITPSNFSVTNKRYLEKIDTISIILDLSCMDYQELLNKFASQPLLFENRLKWLIIIDKPNDIDDRTSIDSTFENVQLRYDTDLTVAVYRTNSSLTLYDVYNPGFGRANVHVTEIGYWMIDGRETEKNNYYITNNLSAYERRINMSDTLLRVATVRETNTTLPLDVYYRDVGHRIVETINKYCYALYLNIRDIHHFRDVITLTNKYFGNWENGTNEGLARIVVNNEADFGPTGGIMKAIRVPTLDFVVPIGRFRSSFIFRNPGHVGWLGKEFLQPFSATSWLVTLGFALLFCAAFKISCSIRREDCVDGLEKSWSYAALITMAAYFQQDTPLPHPTSGRLILILLLLMTLLLYNYYTSIVVSTLLSGLPPSFSTIKELALSHLDVGFEDKPYVRTLFEVSNVTEIRLLYDKKVDPSKRKTPAFLEPEEGIAKVRAGGYAYNTEPATGYAVIDATFDLPEVCDLEEIDLIPPVTCALMAPKHSEYRKVFLVGFKKMMQSGIFSREWNVWFYKKPECQSSANVVQVGIPHVSPAYLVLFSGMIGGLVLLFIEIMHAKLTKRAQGMHNL